MTVPQPDEFFKVQGRRGRFRCLTVTEQGVEAFGGSVDPGGRRAFRSFPLDAAFSIIGTAETKFQVVKTRA